MLMCSCVRLLVVVNNMWVIIEFRLGSIFVLLFSEIIKRSIIVNYTHIRIYLRMTKKRIRLRIKKKMKNKLNKL